MACWEGKARLVTVQTAGVPNSRCHCWFQHSRFRHSHFRFQHSLLLPRVILPVLVSTNQTHQPTHSLICQCHCLQVTMLLARGHDVHSLSRNRSTPLHYAAWNGHLETVNDSE